MIVGIGSDLADIRRIEASIERFGERFIRRIFTDAEQAKANSRTQQASTYAKRWAAKEACAKALGSGVWRQGINWTDLGVVNLPSGQPTMRLTGGAAKRLDAMIPPGMRPHIHVSLTDDHPYAQAFVIIEAVPDNSPPPPALAARPPRV
ncbi:MAG TPA: holo-ACP synthase [Caulobacteraceae bacterium]|jgi:holo-[acyl-carrier protein] synthase